MASEFVLQKALTQLSAALAAMAGRLRNRAVVALEFEGLTTRAKSIASRARELQTSKWDSIDNAARLAAELGLFAAEVAKPAARAGADIEGNFAIVDALAAQAQRVGILGQTLETGATAVAADAELKRLNTTLVAVRESQSASTAIAEDAAELARRAVKLAALAPTLNAAKDDGMATISMIGQELRAFADDANSIATRMSDAQADLAEVVARLSQTAAPKLGMSQPPTPAKRQNAGSRGNLWSG